MKPLRILLADDHVVVRNGLRLILEQQPDFEVVGEASDGREVVRLAEIEEPDVVVMDIGMPNLNGIEATRRIVGNRPKTAVVILSMHSDEGYVVRSLKAGVRTSSRIRPKPTSSRPSALSRREDRFSARRSEGCCRKTSCANSKTMK